MLKRILVRVARVAKVAVKLPLKLAGLLKRLLPTIKVEAQVKVVTVKVTLDWGAPD